MNIVALTGSNRNHAASSGLAEYAAAIMRESGHTVRIIHLYHTPLPLYSPTAENLQHPGVEQLLQSFEQANAIMLTTPEYHGSISGVLKNALDYLGQAHFKGKAVLTASTAGGPVGISSLLQLQAIVRNLHGVNCPEWISIGGSLRHQFEGISGLQTGVHESVPEADERVFSAVRSFLRLAESLRNE
ncbi:NAD(P)H-dependent oxidoreductase [Paenibacillus sp. P96]|uniref:NAD(P)H-dependent oxidoreductase n=1 Tax=Paenibacillus zeirhizosphaerae TaxID=2987519 RepID=A0ABT9FNZ8_9BACL|nr:NADPH-dependent FMN reductase [Paenibacillus sp. P96]MDP4096473.1 NAD(P)H-dependent oxidoreductase [Paenibacillus sp. P96]